MNILSIKINEHKKNKHNGYHQRKTRIYINEKEMSLIENIMTRKLRPYTIYRKEFLPNIIEQLNLPKDTKVKWSQFAGCTSCPCSPGFIVEGDFEKEVFVSVSMD